MHTPLPWLPRSRTWYALPRCAFHRRKLCNAKRRQNQEVSAECQRCLALNTASTTTLTRKWPSSVTRPTSNLLLHLLRSFIIRGTPTPVYNENPRPLRDGGYDLSGYLNKFRSCDHFSCEYRKKRWGQLMVPKPSSTQSKQSLQ